MLSIFYAFNNVVCFLFNPFKAPKKVVMHASASEHLKGHLVAVLLIQSEHQKGHLVAVLLIQSKQLKGHLVAALHIIQCYPDF